MGKILQSVGRVFQGGAKAVSRFPASMLSALAVAGAASILIQLDGRGNQALYHKIQLAFVLGAFLGLALSVLILRLTNKPVPFFLANLAALLAAGGVLYLLLQEPDRIPVLFTARIIAASAVSFLIFLLAISRDIGRNDYNQASFMVLKSALIALIYGLVIMLGLFFVAFTVESLLIKDLSEKVYQHIATWAALGWFAFFLGYFPSFRRNTADEHLATAQKHPAFIEILFAYVLMPIMSILTVVLLIWAVRILIVGEWPEFGQLTAIFSAYSLFGIFLMIMTSQYVQPIATFFRRCFPFAAILFLAFEAYAIVSQVGQSGIKTHEYFVALIWIYALVSAVLMIFLPVARNHLTGWLAIILIVAAVLPVSGYQDLPVAAQTRRLQKVLIRNDMLAEGKIQTAPPGITSDDKIVITDAVEYILRYEDAAKVRWFSDSISSIAAFQPVFGFSAVYPDYAPGEANDQYTYIALPDGFLDISGYQYAASISQKISGETLSIQGKKGAYLVTLTSGTSSKSPKLTVTRDKTVILDKDLTAWLGDLQRKYQGINTKEPTGTQYEDLVLRIEQSGIRMIVVFNSIEIINSSLGQFKGSSLNLNAVYLAE